MNREAFVGGLAAIGTAGALAAKAVPRRTWAQVVRLRGGRADDDTLRIQAALDKVGRSGGTVVLASGAYRITRPLRIGRTGTSLLSRKGALLQVGGSGGIIDVVGGPVRGLTIRLESQA